MMGVVIGITWLLYGKGVYMFVKSGYLKMIFFSLSLGKELSAMEIRDKVIEKFGCSVIYSYNMRYLYVFKQGKRVPWIAKRRRVTNVYEPREFERRTTECTNLIK